MTLSKSIKLSLFTVVAIVFANVSVHAASQTFTVHGPRPVSQAIDKLEEVYAVPITYEDPPYVHDSELAGHRIPIGIPNLSFSYDIPPAGATEQMRKALAANAITNVLAAYNAARGAEMFTQVETDDGFHVIPVRYVNSSGQIDTLDALLSTPVSFAPHEQTAAQALAQILSASMAASGQTNIAPGVMAGLGQTLKVNIGASNEPARLVLDRLLSQSQSFGMANVDCPSTQKSGSQPGVCSKRVPAHLSWRLWCEAGACLLHTRIITPPGAAGGDNVRLPAPPESVLEQERRDFLAHGIAPPR